MPTKHNKKRYQAKPITQPIIVFTGRVFLKYRDEEEMLAAAKGDFMLHPSVEALCTVYQGEYDRTGHAGYFRVDVYDGKAWQPVVLNELFLERENHFRKTECPIDTFGLCEELLEQKAGLKLRRTYREHYEVMEEDERG